LIEWFAHFFGSEWLTHRADRFFVARGNLAKQYKFVITVKTNNTVSEFCLLTTNSVNDSPSPGSFSVPFSLFVRGQQSHVPNTRSHT
jgi:hypothetical protein